MLRIYNVLTAIIAFTGCLSIIISGETNPVFSLIGLGVIPGYYRFLIGKRPANKYVTGTLSIITLLIFIWDSIFLSKDYFIAVAHLTIIFQVIKSFDLKEPWDYLQVYFMALLQLIIASELIFSIIFGVVFIMFLLIFVTVIIFSHFVREGGDIKVDVKKPVFYISILTILLTVSFFISIPRVSGGLWGKYHQKSIRSVGFSKTIDFDSYGRIMLDPTVVMRVEIEGRKDLPYYWRGMTLDYFDGLVWENTHFERESIFGKNGRFVLEPYIKDGYTIQRIFLEPMDNDVVFGLSNIIAIESRGFILYRDVSDALFLPEKKGRRFQYIVYSSKILKKADGFLDGYLQIPIGFEDVKMLAEDLTKGLRNNHEKALKIENYLKENYIYSLDLKEQNSGVNPVKDFLFNSKKGFCEHYATAMVLMLRSIGIPSRIVTGFAGGDLNEYGGYLIIRQSHAHSWVEAVIDGFWLTFDPTPVKITEKPSSVILLIDMLKMKWQRYVIGYSLYDQKKIIRAFNVFKDFPTIFDLKIKSKSLPFIIFAIIIFSVVIILFILYGDGYKKRGCFATRQYLSVRNKLGRLGIKVTSSLTPNDIELKGISRGLSSNFSNFIRLYQEIRFGGRKMNAKERLEFKMLTRRVIKEINSL